jgi:hypothetical protein
VTSTSFVADSSDPLALPLMVVTTKVGTAVMSHNMAASRLRRSTDGRMHACINNRVSPAQLICIFVPDGQ